ncbi:hypothetical protein [Mammaliicoccus vitulinus]|uniref:hypothetical protein n=1 Tax=Mammaliicoccus vitulinus TaxID=71237 RepID=UPI001304F6B3|nr:hypothetical protein [Mammaliicoccus vitulinus]
MNKDEVFRTLQYEMNTEKINSIHKDKLSELYTEIHQRYLDFYETLGNKPEGIEDYFSW